MKKQFLTNIKNVKALLFATLLLTMMASHSGQNTYEYYVGATIDGATLGEEESNPASVSSSYDADHTLTSFKTHFPVEIGVTHMVVRVKTRGAS